MRVSLSLKKHRYHVQLLLGLLITAFSFTQQNLVKVHVLGYIGISKEEFVVLNPVNPVFYD